MSRSCVGEKKEILKQFEREDGACCQFKSYFSTSSYTRNKLKLKPAQPASTTSCEVITSAHSYSHTTLLPRSVNLP